MYQFEGGSELDSKSSADLPDCFLSWRGERTPKIKARKRLWIEPEVYQFEGGSVLDSKSSADLPGSFLSWGGEITPKIKARKRLSIEPEVYHFEGGSVLDSKSSADWEERKEPLKSRLASACDLSVSVQGVYALKSSPVNSLCAPVTWVY